MCLVLMLQLIVQLSSATQELVRTLNYIAKVICVHVYTVSIKLVAFPISQL